MSRRYTVRIISTTDLHAHLFSYDYVKDRPAQGIGLESLVRPIQDQVQGCDAAVLVDNGDLLQGSALGDTAQTLGQDHPNPMIAALNALGYVAGNLGNHDMNYGLDFLSRISKEATFPLLNANITDMRTNSSPKGLVPRFIHRATLDATLPALKIGLTGAAPPQILQWDAHLYADRLKIDDSVETLCTQATHLRDDGADLVIGLCHFGISPTPSMPLAENPAREVAARKLFDGLILGHTHGTLGGGDEPALETMAVMSGYYGSHLGVLEYHLEYTDRWQILSQNVQLIPADPSHAAPFATLAPAQMAHKRTIETGAQALCANELPAQSYLTEIGHDPLWSLMGEAHLTWAQKQDWPHDLPILAAVAPMHLSRFRAARSDAALAADTVKRRDLHQLMPYPNKVRAMRLTGAQIIEYLERAAAYYTVTKEGYLSAQEPAYNFDALFGLDYDIHPTRPARYDGQGTLINPEAHRIEALTRRGAPINPAQEFCVLTNHHRAGGGGHFPAMGPCGHPLPIAHAPSTRDVLLDYLTAHGAWIPSDRLPWRLASDTPTTLRLICHHKARLETAATTHLRARAICEHDDDYQEIEVTLHHRGTA